MKQARSAFSRFAPVVLLSIAIFVASSREQAPMPDLGFTWQDKLFHFLAFTVYGLAVIRAVVASATLTWRVVVIVMLLGAVFAASDEVHQMYVPGRSAEVADWLADMSGMLAALGVYWMHTKRSMRFRRES